VFAYLDHAFIVAVHAVDSLAGLCENEFIDAVAADFTLEAVSMIRVVAGHDSFVEDGEATYVTAIGTVCADRRAV